MSFLQQVNVPLAGLPIHLVCLSNGAVVIVPVGPIRVIWCPSDTGVSAYLFNDCFSLYANGVEAQEFEYGKMYDYRKIPLMKQWLQEFQLQNPFEGG